MRLCLVLNWIEKHFEDSISNQIGQGNVGKTAMTVVIQISTTVPWFVIRATHQQSPIYMPGTSAPLREAAPRIGNPISQEGIGISSKSSYKVEDDLKMLGRSFLTLLASVSWCVNHGEIQKKLKLFLLVTHLLKPRRPMSGMPTQRRCERHKVIVGDEQINMCITYHISYRQ